MLRILERVYFALSLALGRVLRGSRYATVDVVCDVDAAHVRKRRLWYAPLLVALGGPLVRVLDTGVRVLAQAEWEAREGLLYEQLYGKAMQVDDRGHLLLPVLGQRTLAALLEDPRVGETERFRAIELATQALAQFHHRGFTHGDAMAENVLVDVEGGLARWFDFETVHDARRSGAWCRADDVRALLATSLHRTALPRYERVIRLVMDAYSDVRIAASVLDAFDSPLHRPLSFHLGQAPLSFHQHRAIASLLRERVGSPL